MERSSRLTLVPTRESLRLPTLWIYRTRAGPKVNRRVAEPPKQHRLPYRRGRTECRIRRSRLAGWALTRADAPADAQYRAAISFGFRAGAAPSGASRSMELLGRTVLPLWRRVTGEYASPPARRTAVCYRTRQGPRRACRPPVARSGGLASRALAVVVTSFQPLSGLHLMNAQKAFTTCAGRRAGHPSRHP